MVKVGRKPKDSHSSWEPCAMKVASTVLKGGWGLVINSFYPVTKMIHVYMYKMVKTYLTPGNQPGRDPVKGFFQPVGHRSRVRGNFHARFLQGWGG